MPVVFEETYILGYIYSRVLTALYHRLNIIRLYQPDIRLTRKYFTSKLPTFVIFHPLNYLRYVQSVTKMINQPM